MFSRVCVLNANVFITLKPKCSSKMNNEMMLTTTDQSPPYCTCPLILLMSLLDKSQLDCWAKTLSQCNQKERVSYNCFFKWI